MKRKRQALAIFPDGESMFVGEREADSQGSALRIRAFDKSVTNGRWTGGCTLVLPSLEAFTYTLAIPTRDAGEIESIVPNEFERRLYSEGGRFVESYLAWDGDADPDSVVLLVAMPEDLVEGYLARAAENNLRIDHVTVSFDALRRHHLGKVPVPGTGECVLVVGRFGRFADILLVQDDKVLFHRSVPLPAEELERLEIEIERSLLYLENRRYPVQPTVHYYGDEAASETSCLEPLLAGALSLPDERNRIELLPERLRQRIRRRDRAKSLSLFAVGLLLLLVLCVAINDLLYWKEARYLAFLEESTAALGSQAAELSEMMEVIAQSRREAAMQYWILTIVNEVASCAPPDVGVDFLNVEMDGSIVLGGQALERRALFAFMDGLEASAMFSGVKVVSMPLQPMGSVEVVDYRLELRAGRETAP